MRKYLIEFIGTFFLVLVIGLSGNPLAIGSILMVMVYMGGPISGAHYNPAVTLAVWMLRKMNRKNAINYILYQIVASFIAAIIVIYILRDKTFCPAPGNGVEFFYALVVEVAFTFALVLVVLSVAYSKKTTGNSYFGLAIGFTLASAVFAGGSISGGVFNPAVGIGPILVDTANGGNSLENIWLYIVGPVVGGVFGSGVFKITNPEEFDD